MLSYSILIQKAHLEQIYQHSLITYPEECCGLMFGKFKLEQNCKIVQEIWATENSWQNEDQNLLLGQLSFKQNLSKNNRFAIAPEVLFKAQRYARDKELAIIGIYHSHPDNEPIPSAFDQAIAWTTYSYIIIAVKQGAVVQSRSWLLDENHQFQEENIITVNL
jgi:proteasome lid subunit RPN8/RPN11